MADVILTRGLPASGKSTWAKAQLDAHPGQYKRVNKDDLRAILDNGRWSKQNEKLVLRVRDDIIRASLGRGCHVIVDDTNLSPRHERRIRQLVSGINREQGTVHNVWIRDFTDIALETCIERDAERDQPVGEKVIRGMYRQFLAPVAEPAHEVEVAEARSGNEQEAHRSGAATEVEQ
jgi:predicted kinase